MVSQEHAFSVPKLGESYINHIVARCHELIDSGIWQGIEVPRLEIWLRNFETPAERYFAAVVLDALIYRSPAQTHSLLIQLFQRRLPDLSRQVNLREGPIEDWMEQLQDHRHDPGIRLVPVIRWTDPPSKSGPLVCRLLKRHLQLSERWMIWPWQIQRAVKKGVRILVFVDDFLGTGRQFRKFTKWIRLEEYERHSHIVYCPLAAHARGLFRLQDRMPYLHLTTVEALTENHSLFAESSGFFQDGTNSARSAMSFYRELIRSRQLNRLGDSTLGYGRLGLAYAFYHAAPNASLPILWVRAARWEPLFDR